MLEISFTELVLLMWAVFATAGYFNARHDARMAKHILRTFIEDKEARDKMVNAFEDFKKREGTA